ncbi:sensor histidine kinase [Nonomuraea rhodomycinica]|uniref:histidine kinase n=1 Tax=Nonomuraea rhodomycinica TaxID=1712872 RepID=A0A7Y6IXK9_9ACTN|nr:nitrate- and nitrite sensing domain-containing protein [Nonomuraea rhodomycinica]NUW46256.1 sensor histidine kinase [Nonomuraea rhodomycinica]
MLLLPLLSLSALWGFALNLTVGDGQALLRTNTLYQTVGVTSTELGLQLQAERARSAVAVTTRELTKDLGAQRARTDKAVADFRRAAVEAGDAVTAELRRPLDTLDGALARLGSIRADIDAGLSSRLVGINAYNAVLDALFRFYDHMVSVPDLPLFQQATAMQAMGNAREVIAREHALISGALVDGQLTQPEAAAFTEYTATRTFLHSRGLAGLDVALRGPYEKVFDGATFRDFARMEKRIVTTGEPPPDGAAWNAAVGQVMAQLDRLGVSSSEVLSDRATGAATVILVRIGIAGVVGLIAVLASIVISVRLGRRLGAELAGLRAAAVELSEERLPALVERLRRGDDVDAAKDVKPLKVSGSAEITDVGRAFASVQCTAVRAAVGQAELRRGVSQVFLNLARRKQGLLHRQLALLDSMQRRTHDPDRLEELFRVDHLTTRMRRHAESLIVLSGSAPGRAWRKPVSVLDIVRAAVAEVEEYTRVTVESMPAGAIDGGVAADLTHLVAELVENATLYSPPDTPIHVRGDLVSNGYAIEVEDRGLGLPQAEYAAINARLARPPEFDLADSDRLGLFVVGKLAERHGIQVMLRRSPFGGTTAIVLVPRSLVSEQTALTAGDGDRDTGREAGEDTGGGAARSTASGLPSRTRKKKALAVVSGGTHAGLPTRVRQANLAPQLRADPTPEPEPEQTTERSPDEVRDLFSAFQRGTQRAREEAKEEGEA